MPSSNLLPRNEKDMEKTYPVPDYMGKDNKILNFEWNHKNIGKIKLLSEEEYCKFKPIIPELTVTWWLQSESEEGKYGTCDYVACVAYNDGSIDPRATNWRHYVRPALYVLGANDLISGDKITIFSRKWTVLEVREDHTAYVLCDSAIALRRFDRESSEWEKSELKDWIEKWCDSMKAVSSKCKLRILKWKDEFTKKYKSIDSIEYVFIPLSIYAVCALVGGFVLNFILQDSITLSSWCDWLMSHLVYVLAFFNIRGFLCFFFAVTSFHKDTSLRHILSIIISQIAINLLSESSANPALVLSLQIFIIFAYVRIRNYLREIKYYS